MQSCTPTSLVVYTLSFKYRCIFFHLHFLLHFLFHSLYFFIDLHLINKLFYRVQRRENDFLVSNGCHGENCVAKLSREVGKKSNNVV